MAFMRAWWVALLLPGLALAQPTPGPGIPTPTGTLGGVGIYCWNGSAIVMCGTGAAGAGGSAVATSPAARTLVTLDVKTVTTGGTAVTALTAGHRTAGGWIYNPSVATVNLCINEIGTAVGTTSSGDTTCIQPGVTYTLQPAAGAVSVISSDSAHPFSGMGLQ
jgi:hypothetical protein